MKTKHFWMAGVATAALSPVLPGLIITYFGYAMCRWFAFAIENDRQQDRWTLPVAIPETK